MTLNDLMHVELNPFAYMPPGTTAHLPAPEELLSGMLLIGGICFGFVAGLWLLLGLLKAADILIARFPRAWSAVAAGGAMAARWAWRGAVLFVALCGLVFLFATILGAGM